MAVDYSFYEGTYGGSAIPETAWTRLELKAFNKLCRFTFDRLGPELTDSQKFAVCDMVECLYEYGKREGKASENTDGYNVSYSTDKTLDMRLYNIASDYLLHTGILNLGVDDNVNE